MPVKDKLIAVNEFSGGIDSDTADEILQANKIREGLNIEYQSTGEGQVGIVRNIKGNILISTPLPDGENITLGSREDEENDCIYWINWNENGFHTVYKYDSITNKVIVVLQNLTDSGETDIMRLSKDHLILHMDVVENNLLYWVDGNVWARKININKCLDKSDSGYGPEILEEFITAYKLPPAFSPKAEYFTNEGRISNLVYGKMFKFAARYIYDDGEISNWSDFSNVPLPEFEPSLGVTAIENNNNGIRVVIDTGSEIVEKIQIAVKINQADFALVTTLDKEKLGLSDRSEYEYNFYNDGFYTITSPEKILRSFSYLPKNPRTQSFVQSAMVYGGGIEGFDDVDIDMSVDVSYEDLFIPIETDNELNSPSLTVVNHIIDNEGRARWTRNDILVGPDVLKGNIFSLFSNKGWFLTYTATAYDTAQSVASKLYNLVAGTEGFKDPTDYLPDELGGPQPSRFIQDPGGGTIFITAHRKWGETWYVDFYPYTRAVETNSLKETGSSVRVIKSGSNIKYGIIYEDEEGQRKSLTYTNDNLLVYTKFITEDPVGVKLTVHTITINHQPPIWAKYYQIVRTDDLTYRAYIQLLIQQVTEVETTVNNFYVDLVVGSLFTYQKIHPNTILRYQFEKGDRIRLIKYVDPEAGPEDPGTFYEPYEAEVLSYSDRVEDIKRETITITDNDIVTIGGLTDPGAVGKYLVFGNPTFEREIIEVVNGTQYRVARIVEADPNAGTEQTFNQYTLVDTRGVIRIRRPEEIELEDYSIVELFKPTASNILESSRFYEFQKKFRVLNFGTEDRAHAGTDQDQTDSQPAIVKVGEGTAYVRNRQLPTTNNIPGTQSAIDLVEDANYSDFYESNLNDNGRTNAEYDGSFERRFGERFRFSNNYIEDTRINGLNDFDALDRMDINDSYGDIMRTFYKERRLFTFKELKTGWIPIHAAVIQDQSDQDLLATSAELLNDIQYFLWEGGIGNMPESLATYGNWLYFVSPNSGVWCRIGGSGIVPISEIYAFDSRGRDIIEDAAKYNARIFGGFDKSKGQVIWAIEQYDRPAYDRDFGGGDWILETPLLPQSSPYEILTPPSNGTIIPGQEGELTYEPDQNYTGPDSFTYRIQLPGGEFSQPRNVCIVVDYPPNRGRAWRPIDPFCITETFWGNDEQSQDFTRDNCPPGSEGSTVTYTIPVDTYFSDESQEAANQLALDDIQQNGQTYANENGTCIPLETAWRGIDPTCELENEQSIPANAPDGMYHDGPTDKLYICEGWGTTVLVVNAADLSTITSIPVGFHPRNITPINATTIMVVCEDGDTNIIDIPTDTVSVSGSVPVDHTLGGFLVPGWGGDIGVPDQNTGNLYRVSQTTGNPVGTSWNIDTGLTYGATLPTDNNLIALGTTLGMIHIFNLTTESVVNTIPLPGNPGFVVTFSFQNISGTWYLFTANQAGRVVAKYQINGDDLLLNTDRMMLSPLNRTFYDASQDILYLSEQPDRVYRLDPVTLETTELITLEGFARSAVIISDENRAERIYISDYGFPDVGNPGLQVAALGAGINTGNAYYLNLEEYYVSTGDPTGVTKPNEAGDPDYIPPYPDAGTCPIPT